MRHASCLLLAYIIIFRSFKFTCKPNVLHGAFAILASLFHDFSFWFSRFLLFHPPSKTKGHQHMTDISITQRLSDGSLLVFYRTLLHLGLPRRNCRSLFSGLRVERLWVRRCGRLRDGSDRSADVADCSGSCWQWSSTGILHSTGSMSLMRPRAQTTSIELVQFFSSTELKNSVLSKLLDFFSYDTQSHH